MKILLIIIKDNKNILKKETNICATPGCGLEAKLRCPECLKLKITENSYFCGKDCFKKYWLEHKKIHEKCKIKVHLYIA
jgi:methionyl aminopeptidase